jgi:hypothetical protein
MAAPLFTLRVQGSRVSVRVGPDPRSQCSLRVGPLLSDQRDHGQVEEEWYLYRGTCASGHRSIAPVRMAGRPGQDNDAELGVVRTERCSTCGAPVELRWDEEAEAR